MRPCFEYDYDFYGGVNASLKLPVLSSLVVHTSRRRRGEGHLYDLLWQLTGDFPAAGGEFNANFIRPML